MRFLRTASTGRLLAGIGGVLAAIAVTAAVAVAASSGGPVPKRESLAQAIHQALKAPAVQGITARITFTNNLIAGGEIQGADPLLQGGTGRLWLSSASHLLRLEIQSNNGDAQLVLNNRSFWIYDPASHTVYEGTLPAAQAGARKHHAGELPTVAEMQSTLNRLMQRAFLSGAIPTDIAGQPTYTVRISPRHNGGLLGALEFGWDAVRGVPLRFAVFARGDSTPVLELAATNVSYGKVPASSFAVSPPSGSKVVQIAQNSAAGGQPQSGHEVMGLAAVSRALPFKLLAPASVAGLPRGEVKLLHAGEHPAALVTYGQGLGSIVVLEQAGSGHSLLGGAAASGPEGQGLTPPTVSIAGTTGQELDTALGTIISFTRNHVAYTVLGSVKPAVARAAARGL